MEGISSDRKTLFPAIVQDADLPIVADLHVPEENLDQLFGDLSELLGGLYCLLCYLNAK